MTDRRWTEAEMDEILALAAAARALCDTVERLVAADASGGTQGGAHPAYDPVWPQVPIR